MLICDWLFLTFETIFILERKNLNNELNVKCITFVDNVRQLEPISVVKSTKISRFTRMCLSLETINYNYSYIAAMLKLHNIVIAV